MVSLTPEVVHTAVKTASGESISTGVWTLVGVIVTTIGTIWMAYIRQWGPWKKRESDARDADFARLREEIATLKDDNRKAVELLSGRIEKLENEVKQARSSADMAKERAARSDAKLQSALTACEVLLGLVEREMPDAHEISLVKRLLAQAAADDMGVGSAMRDISRMPATPL